MKKPELLAPAGNYEALLGAINAGADAVYLGGELYGARAYADNFTQDEILSGLRMAHLFGRRIYLTVNTLVKEKELDGLYDFLLPFYEEGLDGVIVQDLGVLRYIRTRFPGLPIHASTQMTLTGRYGAQLMKDEGVSRIVPARELSLEEIRKIKQETNLEIEAFIHGAMCYCYSGQCLFSSILGGRSGNRGRCAQPCRLPYKTGGGEECYPLSMRDMRTIDILPELIDAGIDSFKIEGRMKKPAYAAGVTAVYRKYIDLYVKDRENYRVDKKDLEVLNALYIRSETSDGYYMRRNGKEMISLSSPAYCATDEKLLTDIENRFLNGKMTIPAKAEIFLTAGKEALLRLTASLPEGEKTAPARQVCTAEGKAAAECAPGPSGKAITVTVKGDVVQQAVKQPLSADKIREQIQKSGNSFVRIEAVDVRLGEPVFLPVKALNELRRRCVEALETAVIRENGFKEKRCRGSFPEKSATHTDQTPASRLYVPQLHVSVQTAAQMEAALKASVSRIYLDYGLLTEPAFGAKLSELTQSQSPIPWQTQKTSTVWEPSQKLTQARPRPEIYAATPYITRDDNLRYLEILAEFFGEGRIDGVLVRNLESYGFLSGRIPAGKLVIDAGLYVWNREALLFWKERAGEFYLPIEGTRQEWKELLRAVPELTMKASAVVYGLLPMMVTAGCLKKTSGKCDKRPEILTLTDRYEKQFPVYTDCRSCYNVIYNSVSLSLHGMFSAKSSGTKSQKPSAEKRTAGTKASGDVFFRGNYRLDFTVESKEETSKIIKYFQELPAQYREPVYREYTTGHYKRGVE